MSFGQDLANASHTSALDACQLLLAAAQEFLGVQRLRGRQHLAERYPEFMLRRCQDGAQTPNLIRHHGNLHAWCRSGKQ
jgi:hypothetical protein